MRNMLLQEVQWLPAPPAACQQQQQRGRDELQQQQQQAASDPLAAASDFLGLKVLGGGVATAAAAAAAAAVAAEEQPVPASATVDVEGSLPPYSSAWERHLAYNYGLYDPRRLHKALTPQQVAADVSLFKQTLETAEPQDACKYLQLEEFKCLREHQAHRDPETASTKCVKWFQEWRQCKWDQDKLQKGYAFAEDRLPAKHKPYIATPDTQYA
ncbi:uncharacterized protein LOC113146503 [Cyclospora cayetanensis]|uniref:Uncharacterized protein LOC113146503 n=1 Tax=Cyclospora cayetanensis TaxID=88456 RepID=A0A6P6RPQ0_9EIME|nr:uncharacterized protein LOC113146503 [Cyclospora cayetanensis]